jgi:hypothetical protein
MAQVEVSLSKKQAQLFKNFVQQAANAQAQLNQFAAALFASLDDVETVMGVQLVEEQNGVAKLIGMAPDPKEQE